MRGDWTLLSRRQEAVREARQQSNGVLLARLRQYGTPVQAATLKRHCQRSVSVREVWRRLNPPATIPPPKTLRDVFLEPVSGGKPEPERSIGYFACLRGLWERLCPERPMFESVEDLVLKGEWGKHLTAGGRKDDAQEAAWYQGWKTLTHAMKQWEETSISALEKRLRCPTVLLRWLQFFLINLYDRGAADRGYYLKVRQLAEEMLAHYQLPQDLQMQCLEIKAKVHYQFGQWRLGDNEVIGLLNQDMFWSEGWRVWAASYLGRYGPDNSRFDPERAETILQKARSFPVLVDDISLLQLLAQTYEAQGREKEAEEAKDQYAQVIDEANVELDSVDDSADDE